MILVSSNYISTSALYDPNYIAHHGIKGQRWGIRRYRNDDGSLTDLGKKRYANDAKKFNKAYSETEKKYSKVLKRAEKLHNYSKRPRWLMDDEVTTNKAKRLQRADRRYTKSLKKAEKIYGEMSKKYSDIAMLSLDPDTVRRGAEIMLKRRMKNNLGSYIVSENTGNRVVVTGG